MLKEYSVHEVLGILNEFYIPCTQQSVTKWIREGRIPGDRTDYRKGGYKIREEDLYNFIEEERVGLPAVMEGYKKYVEMKKAQIISITPVQNDEIQGINEKNEGSSSELFNEEESNPEDIEIERAATKDGEQNIEKTQDVNSTIESLEKSVHILMTSIEQMNEKFMKLECKIIAILDKDNQLENRSEEKAKVPKSHEKPTKLKKPVSIEDFLKGKWEIVPGENYSEEQISEHLKLVYHELFTDKGELKQSHYSNENIDEGRLVLPNGEKRKTLKPFLKSYVKESFMKVNKQIKKEEKNSPSTQNNNSNHEDTSKEGNGNLVLLSKKDKSHKPPKSHSSNSIVEEVGPP